MRGGGFLNLLFHRVGDRGRCWAATNASRVPLPDGDDGAGVPVVAFPCERAVLAHVRRVSRLEPVPSNASPGNAPLCGKSHCSGISHADEFAAVTQQMQGMGMG